MRSGAMAHILAQIGWRTGQLEGGYKTYRRYVIAALETLPFKFDFCVISGATGSGKSHLLHALAEQGGQVLDLEKLAQHRGSLLGDLPGQPQPTQKTFETRLWDALRAFTSDRPVYIEAESRKIGVLSVPNVLLLEAYENCKTPACPLRLRTLERDAPRQPAEAVFRYSKLSHEFHCDFVILRLKHPVVVQMNWWLSGPGCVDVPLRSNQVQWHVVAGRIMNDPIGSGPDGECKGCLIGSPVLAGDLSDVAGGGIDAQTTAAIGQQSGFHRSGEQVGPPGEQAIFSARDDQAAVI